MVEEPKKLGKLTNQPIDAFLNGEAVKNVI
jgi:hypothetical protein